MTSTTTSCAAEWHTTYTLEFTNTEQLRADDVREAIIEAGAVDARVMKVGRKLIDSAKVTGDDMVLQIMGKLHLIDIPGPMWREAQEFFGVEDPTDQLRELMIQWINKYGFLPPASSAGGNDEQAQEKG